MTEPDFSREHRVLHLASALQAGTATPEEVQEAADSLSYAAGQRFALEMQVSNLERALAFYMRVMKIFHDIDIVGCLLWEFEDGLLQFYVESSNLFDQEQSGELLTPENLGILEKAIEDIEARGEDVHWAALLFSTRVRAQRPHPDIHIPDDLKDLFAVEEIGEA